MKPNENTPPALREFTVWADRRCYQTVKAASPEEAHRIAGENYLDFEPCSHGSENYELLPEVADEETDEEFQVGQRDAHADLRKASQDLYDRLQEYLDVSDAQLIEQGHGDLVKAMDDLEAAWRNADGTVPEPSHEHAA